jgi:hypothetical protein
MRARLTIRDAVGTETDAVVDCPDDGRLDDLLPLLGPNAGPVLIDGIPRAGSDLTIPITILEERSRAPSKSPRFQ